MHMVAVVAGYKNALVGTGLAYSCLGCTNRLTKCYSHFVGGSFLTVKAIWVLNGASVLTSANLLMSGHGQQLTTWVTTSIKKGGGFIFEGRPILGRLQ